MSAGGRVAAGLSVVLVSVYLLAVGAWLVITRRIPAPGLRRVLRAALRPPYAGRLTGIRHETGACHVAPLPAHLLSDQESVSSLALFEDGRALGPAHAAHDDIRTLGGGRFSHWGAAIYFSASDGSDPGSNGRSYEVREQRGAKR